MATQQSSSVGGILFLVAAGAAVVISAANFVGAKLEPVLYPEQHTARLAQSAAEADAERRRKAEAAATAGKAAAEQAAKDESNRKYEIAYSDARIALANVRSQLRDPSSAQFRNVWAYRYRDQGASVVCGEVNGTNGFGGYVGFVEFLAIGSTVITVQDSGFNELAGEHCALSKRWFEMKRF